MILLSSSWRLRDIVTCLLLLLPTGVVPLTDEPMPESLVVKTDIWFGLSFKCKSGFAAIIIFESLWKHKGEIILYITKLFFYHILAELKRQMPSVLSLLSFIIYITKWWQLASKKPPVLDRAFRLVSSQEFLYKNAVPTRTTSNVRLS